MTLAERDVIPHDDARALIAALLALHQAPSAFVPAAEYGDLYTNREAWLTERTEAGLGVARARREALTTAYHLVLCAELLGLGEALAEAARIEAARTQREAALRRLLADAEAFAEDGQ